MNIINLLVQTAHSHPWISGLIAGMVVFFICFMWFALVPSLICGIIVAIATSLVLGFGGVGHGGGKGDGKGEAQQHEIITPHNPPSTTITEKKPVENRRIVKVNFKEYHYNNQSYSCNEFKEMLHSSSSYPRQITLDYRGKYKAINIKEFTELAQEFPEICFTQINKQ